MKPISRAVLGLLAALLFAPVNIAIAQIAIEIPPRIDIAPHDFARPDFGQGADGSSFDTPQSIQKRVRDFLGDGRPPHSVFDVARALNNPAPIKAFGDTPPPGRPPVVGGGKPDDCESNITTARLQTLKSSVLATRDRNNIDDAIQEAVIAYVKQCREGKDYEIKNLDSWLFTTTKNKLLNIQRTERTKRRLESLAVNSPSDELGIRSARANDDYITPSLGREIYGASSKLANELSVEHLGALHGKYIEDLTAGEIARKEGLKLTTVQGRLRKGDEVLAGAIQDLATPPTPSPHDRDSAASTAFGEQLDGLLSLIAAVIAVAIGVAVIAKMAPGSKPNVSTRSGSTTMTDADRAYRAYAARQAAKPKDRYMNG
jgi:DNA-directed RNA polymerase specialized sigma24 family protein